MNIEEIAQRYNRLDGFQLVDYCSVALPFWFVAYEAQVLAEKPLPLIDEFLLRAIQAQVDSIGDLAAFLGIGEKITIRRLGGLHSIGYIRFIPSKAEAPASYVLTQTGIIALRDAASIQPKEKKIVVSYDGVSQRIIPRQLENYEVLTHHQIKARGLLEIPALPENRPPTEDLLNRLDLNRDIPEELRVAWEINHILAARKAGQLHRRAREAYMAGETKESISGSTNGFMTPRKTTSSFSMATARRPLPRRASGRSGGSGSAHWERWSSFRNGSALARWPT